MHPDQGLSRKKFADAAMDATKLSAEELRNLDMKPIELSVTQGDPLSSQEFFEKLLPVMIEKVYKQAILMEQRDKDRLQASCDVTIDAMMRNSVYENSSHTLKLFQACAAGDYQEVVRALDNGANLKHKLDLSLTNSSMENCEWLWLNYIDCKDGTTPLHFSMFHGYGDISSYLIKKGANCNRKNEDGKAPIDVARSRGHWEILQGLGLHSPSKTKK